MINEDVFWHWREETAEGEGFKLSPTTLSLSLSLALLQYMVYKSF